MECRTLPLAPTHKLRCCAAELLGDGITIRHHAKYEKIHISKSEHQYAQTLIVVVVLTVVIVFGLGVIYRAPLAWILVKIGGNGSYDKPPGPL